MKKIPFSRGDSRNLLNLPENFDGLEDSDVDEQEEYEDGSKVERQEVSNDEAKSSQMLHMFKNMIDDNLSYHSLQKPPLSNRPQSQNHSEESFDFFFKKSLEDNQFMERKKSDSIFSRILNDVSQLS